MKISDDKVVSFIVKSVLVLVVLAVLYLCVFGIRIGSFTFTFTGVTQEQCNNGYLFLTHKTSNGVSIVQVLDENSKPIKCKE